MSRPRAERELFHNSWWLPCWMSESWFIFSLSVSCCFVCLSLFVVKLKCSQSRMSRPILSEHLRAGSAVGYTRWCSRVVLRFQVNVVRANCVARKHSSGVRGYKQNTVCTPWEALESTQAILHRSMDPTLLEPSQKRTHGDRVDWNTFSLTNATRPLVSFFVSFGNCNLYVAHLVVSNYKIYIGRRLRNVIWVRMFLIQCQFQYFHFSVSHTNQTRDIGVIIDWRFDGIHWVFDTLHSLRWIATAGWIT